MATASVVMTRKPLFIQAATGDTAIEYDGYLMRLLVGAIWARTGIITNDAFKITQRAAGADLSIDLAPGFAVLGPTDGTSPDKYLVYQGSTLNLPLTGFTTSPAGLRTHKVWLAIYDKQKMSAGTLYEGQVMATEDTGAGAPTPTNALFPGLVNAQQLGTFTLTTGQSTVQTAQITNSIRHANLGGSHSSITINAGFVDGSATLSVASPKAIRSGTTVKLQGAIRKTALADFTPGSYIIGTVGDTFAPSVPRYVLAPAGSAANVTAFAYRLTISTSGMLSADIPAGYTNPAGGGPDWLGLDGVNYEID